MSRMIQQKVSPNFISNIKLTAGEEKLFAGCLERSSKKFDLFLVLYEANFTYAIPV